MWQAGWYRDPRELGEQKQAAGDWLLGNWAGWVLYMADNNNQDETIKLGAAKRMVGLTIQAGCLTLIVAGIALAAGLWLDARLGTAPRWTLILLIGSAPLALGGVYLLVRRKLLKGNKAAKTEILQDEIHDI